MSPPFDTRDLAPAGAGKSRRRSVPPVRACRAQQHHRGKEVRRGPGRVPSSSGACALRVAFARVSQRLWRPPRVATRGPMTSPAVHERRLPWSGDRRRGAGPGEDATAAAAPPGACSTAPTSRSRAGELVAVVGRSGSGKSTLLHLLGGLDRPRPARSRSPAEPLDGRPERELTRVRRRHVGFVFQAYHLVPELTGEENVLLPTRLPGSAARRAPPRGRALIDAPRAQRCGGAAAPRAQRRRAAAPGGRPRAGPRSRPSCWPTSRPATSTPSRAATVLDAPARGGRRRARGRARHPRRGGHRAADRVLRLRRGTAGAA